MQKKKNVLFRSLLDQLFVTFVRTHLRTYYTESVAVVRHCQSTSSFTGTKQGIPIIPIRGRQGLRTDPQFAEEQSSISTTTTT